MGRRGVSGAGQGRVVRRLTSGGLHVTAGAPSLSPSLPRVGAGCGRCSSSETALCSALGGGGGDHVVRGRGEVWTAAVRCPVTTGLRVPTSHRLSSSGGARPRGGGGPCARRRAGGGRRQRRLLFLKLSLIVSNVLQAQNSCTLSLGQLDIEWPLILRGEVCVGGEGSAWADAV